MAISRNLISLAAGRDSGLAHRLREAGEVVSARASTGPSMAISSFAHSIASGQSAPASSSIVAARPSGLAEAARNYTDRDQQDACRADRIGVSR